MIGDNVADGDHPALKSNRAPTAGQLKMLKSLPDNGHAEWPTGKWTIPVSTYIDPARFQQELDKVFTKQPVAIGPSGLLPKNGSYFLREIQGKEIIFTRDMQGQVHALHNVCMHRASKLVTNEKTESGKLLVCPFHAWSFDLSGKLIAVPREETFEGLCKDKLGLAKLRVREAGGLIWLLTDSDAPDTLAAINEELITDLDALGVPEMHLFDYGVHHVKANWKLVMDTFMEGYHVVRLHAQSLQGRFEDTIPTVNHLGPHMRRSSGRAGFVQTNIPPREHSLDELRKTVTIVYNIFPSAVLICSPRYISLLTMIPVSVRETIVTNYMLTNGPGRDEAEVEKFRQSHILTDVTTFPEDFMASEYEQKGMESGVIKEITLGSIERYIWDFSKTVEGYILDKPFVPSAD